MVHGSWFVVHGSWFMVHCSWFMGLGLRVRSYIVQSSGLEEKMATIQSFEEIEAWQKARELTRAVYACSGQGAFSRDFGLRDQIRRAAVSIMSNIAEGFERGGSAEFVQFLAIAKGSASEVEAQLYVAFDQGYINQ